MLGLFRKKSKKVALRSSFYPRDNRLEIEGDVYIKRAGQATLRSSQGNISDGGLYLVLPGHNLVRGKKVEVILVSKTETVSRINRLMGIVIRIDEAGVALVTYKKQEMNTQSNLQREEQLLQQEFGKL